MTIIINVLVEFDDKLNKKIFFVHVMIPVFWTLSIVTSPKSSCMFTSR